MHIKGLYSYMKQKGSVLLSLSGIACLILSLVLIASFKRENERRYTEILENLEEVKNGGHLLNKARVPVRGSNSRLRKKRDVDSQERSREGAMYIRWGRKTCPGNGTELVYSGVAAGSWHGHPGAATNQQCLPNNPEWERYTDTAAYAFIYGMEFEEALTGLMDMSDNVQQTLLNHNVPCAVCRSQKRISSLMVPAKYNCFHGWHLEYHGYLMAGHHGSNSGTQYICVDEAPEPDKAGYRDENGALLYRVTAQCGSLTCPKYVQGREITCVVCTK